MSARLSRFLSHVPVTVVTAWPRFNRHSSPPSESGSEGEEGEAVEGLSAVSGGEAAAGVERVEGADEAGAGECGVIAEEARTPGRAGEDCVGLEGGETGAEGRGGAAPAPLRAGPTPADPKAPAPEPPPRPSGQSPWRIASRSGRAEHPARATERGTGAGSCGRQAPSGAPPRLSPPPAWAPRGTRVCTDFPCPGRGGSAPGGPCAPPPPPRVAACPEAPGLPHRRPARRTPCASSPQRVAPSPPPPPDNRWEHHTSPHPFQGNPECRLNLARGVSRIASRGDSIPASDETTARFRRAAHPSPGHPPQMQPGCTVAAPRAPPPAPRPSAARCFPTPGS